MPGPIERIDRATFVKRSSAVLAAVLMRGPSPDLFARASRDTNLEHPEPRPGITSERVLATSELTDEKKDVLDAYDAARTYPQIFDGIACGCGCSGKDGMHRSLLVCYESKQPTGCAACRSEAKLVARSAKQDYTLAEIRAEVDKKYR